MCSASKTIAEFPIFVRTMNLLYFCFALVYSNEMTRRSLWLCVIRVQFSCLLMSLASIYFISTVLSINTGRVVYVCLTTVCGGMCV